MGEDLSTAAKIGIVMIIIGAIIAIVFSIMAIMKNMTTQSTSDLQGSLNSVIDQRFDDYDQRTVTGAQVISAVKMFQNQPYALVVITKRGPTTSVYGLQGVQYLAGTAKTNVSGITAANIATAATTGVITGELPASFSYNNNRVNMNSRNSNAYISNSSSFNSYLIKTTGNDVIGIVFNEIG